MPAAQPTKTLQEEIKNIANDTEQTLRRMENVQANNIFQQLKEINAQTHAAQLALVNNETHIDLLNIGIELRILREALTEAIIDPIRQLQAVSIEEMTPEKIGLSAELKALGSGGGGGDIEASIQNANELIQAIIFQGNFIVDGISNWLELIFQVLMEIATSNIKLKSAAKVDKEEKDEFSDPVLVGLRGVFDFFVVILEKFNVFQAILTAFEPTLDIISDLFEMLGDIMAATIMPVIQPLNDALIGLMPLFAQMGEVLGGMIAEVLGTFIDILVQFMPIIEPILEVFLALIQVALIPLQIVLQILSPLLQELLPHIENFSTFLSGMAGFIIDIANAFIDFINKMDVFNWFPDLQRLEKIDLGTKQEALVEETKTTNEILRELVEETKPKAKNVPPITKFIPGPIVTPGGRRRFQ